MLLLLLLLLVGVPPEPCQTYVIATLYILWYKKEGGGGGGQTEIDASIFLYFLLLPCAAVSPNSPPPTAPTRSSAGLDPNRTMVGVRVGRHRDETATARKQATPRANLSASLHDARDKRNLLRILHCFSFAE